MHTVNFQGRSPVQIKLEAKNVLGQGASGKVYKVEVLSKYYAAKIFHTHSIKTQNKIKAMTDMWSQITVAERDYFNKLAWPVTPVQKNGNIIGFLMPLIEPKKHLNINVFYESILKNKITIDRTKIVGS